MAYLDFFTGFATTGRIFGAGVGTRPEDWPPLLGEEFFDASWNPRHRVLQFGFVDINFGNETGEWICDMILIKPTRWWEHSAAAPARLAERYGEFPDRVVFDDVAAALVAAGAEVRRLPREGKVLPEIYWVPDGKVVIEAVTTGMVEGYADLRPGDAHSMSAQILVDMPAGYGTAYHPTLGDHGRQAGRAPLS
jgi:hypothetical protein